MKKLLSIFVLTLTAQEIIPAQCNPGLNLGAVIVPTHANAANSGNFSNPTAWQQAASWLDTLNLDYRQPYITWTDIVPQINNNIPTYSAGTAAFQNQLNTWAGNTNVHVVYTTTKVGVLNTLETFPTGFGTFTSFLDTAYINQNYNAIKYILTNVHNVKWISIGNEIETYFGGAYLNTGRLTQYATFLNILKSKINTDFPTIKVGTIFAFHTLTFNNELNMIDSMLNSVDYIGYTFYYTTTSAQTCWDSPATVQTWLNTAKTKVGSKKMLLTETCMGDGGGSSQNCGSQSKQLAYADTLLRWYKNNTIKVEGMTWFTITDPYLGWQTGSTLWNTCGLIDSSGVTVQPAGTIWNHICTSTGIGPDDPSSETALLLYPNPFRNSTTIQRAENIKGEIKISVYNTLGCEITQFKMNSDKYVLDLSLYNEGIYYFRIENNTEIRIQKAILIK